MSVYLDHLADKNLSMNVSVPSGESLSPSIDLVNCRLRQISIPSNWASHTITFQGSVDGIHFYDLYDDLGEVTYPVVAGKTINIDSNAIDQCRYLKIRGGTATRPVV